MSLHTMQRRLPAFGVPALVSLLLFHSGCFSSSMKDRIWPISGTSQPDLPQSNTFGPRLQISQGDRWDYHTGLDIPARICTPVHAIDDGVVRLSGRYDFYIDNTISITHSDWPERVWNNQQEGDNRFHSIYLHLNSTYVREQQRVKKGDVIGCTGFAQASGFAHLHFEILAGGTELKNGVHPWMFLPYPDRTIQNITLFSQNMEGNENGDWIVYQVHVHLPSDELDVYKISLEFIDAEERIVQQDGNPFVFTYDFNRVLWDSNGVTSVMDRPQYKNMIMQPSHFNHHSPQLLYNVEFLFGEDVMIPENAAFVVAKVEDVRGNVVEQKVKYDRALAQAFHQMHPRSRASGGAVKPTSFLFSFV